MAEKKFKATLEMARKSRDELMGALAVAHSTPAIPGAADQVCNILNLNNRNAPFLFLQLCVPGS
jgi:hypothetical protein